MLLGNVLGLEISIVINPPMIDITPKAVCGTNWPKIDVAPIKGAQSSQILAQTIVEKAHMRFFSTDTNSVVHVVNIANVLEMAILVPMAVWKESNSISNQTFEKIYPLSPSSRAQPGVFQLSSAEWPKSQTRRFLLIR